MRRVHSSTTFFEHSRQTFLMILQAGTASPGPTRSITIATVCSNRSHDRKLIRVVFPALLITVKEEN
jgi:hypothetical protein